MRIRSLLLLGAVLVAALLVHVLSRGSARRDAQGTPPGVGPPTAAENGGFSGERAANLEARIRALSVRLASLERRVTRAAAASSPKGVSSAFESPERAREFVLGILAEERARLAEEGEVQARTRHEEVLGRRTEELATALELLPGERDALHGILRAELDRRLAIADGLRVEPLDPGVHELVQAELTRLMEWKERELLRKLGPELARRVQDYDQRNPGRLIAEGREPATDD